MRHPLRKVAVIVNDALKALDSKLSRLYAPDGAGPRSHPSGCSGGRWSRSFSRSASSGD